MIFIPVNVPSSKNSRRNIRTKSGRSLSLQSKLCESYEMCTWAHWIAAKTEFFRQIRDLKPPYIVSFFFIRDTKRVFDYINAAQEVQDLMVKYGWIADDNCDYLIPVFTGHSVSKKNAGVEIQVLRGLKTYDVGERL